VRNAAEPKVLQFGKTHSLSLSLSLSHTHKDAIRDLLSLEERKRRQ
jgi:hypothetical protein